LENLRGEIFSQSLVSTFRMDDKDFTRNRKQSFSGTLLFMFNLLRKSLTVEIDIFVRHLNQRLSAGVSYFTASAFVQSRRKIDPGVFKHLSSIIIRDFYTDDNADLRLFKGLRILAADCSIITLPFTKELKEQYGVVRNAETLNIVQARVSALYDVVNHLALDVVLDKVHTSERELALRHMHAWQKNDLVIYDRGYPSFEFINEHIRMGADCLIRAKTVHSPTIVAFVASGKRSLITRLQPNQDRSFKGKNYNRRSTIQVRLLRVELPSGETEVLITTLLDSKKWPAKAFKELYFMRWGIETFYDELKNKLKIEHFSGYSDNTIQQDIFCAIFISNLQSIIVNGLQDDLEVQNEGKKYQYKVNNNLSYGFLKNRVLELLCKKAPLEMVLKDLETLFLKNTIPIRANRTNSRNTQKYRYKDKPLVTKNQKDSL
jgi:hypothetical protein